MSRQIGLPSLLFVFCARRHRHYHFYHLLHDFNLDIQNSLCPLVIFVLALFWFLHNVLAKMRFLVSQEFGFIRQVIATQHVLRRSSHVTRSLRWGASGPNTICGAKVNLTCPWRTLQITNEALARPRCRNMNTES